MRWTVWMALVGLLLASPAWAQDEAKKAPVEERAPAEGGDVAEEPAPDPRMADEGVVGITGEATLPLGSFADQVDTAGGVGIFAGYEMHHGDIIATYMASGTFHFMPTPGQPNEDADADIKRLMVGAEVGYQQLLPSDQALVYKAFMHLGYGWLSATSARESEFVDGFAMETGLGVGYSPVPPLTLSIRGGYGLLNTGFDGESLSHWALVGGQATIGF